MSFLLFFEYEEDLRVGAILREQNVLPYENLIMIDLWAKSAIDNCRAGRAAKGANPLLCAKQKRHPIRVLFLCESIRLIAVASNAAG